MNRQTVHRAARAASRTAVAEREPVHSVPYDEPGRIKARARCGIYVNRHAQRGAVTCETCLEEIAHFDSLDLGLPSEEFAMTHPLFADLPADEPESDEPSAAPVMGAIVETAAASVLTFPGPVERATQEGSVGTGPDRNAMTGDPELLEFQCAELVDVAFPVLAPGVARMPFSALLDPAKRVAELVEALEPVLAPPPVVANLEKLVLEANALTVTDAASYQRATALYEQLAANEKGIEETIGPVVAFFHRPWKALTSFRARFAKPVLEAKQRLSDDAGKWKLADDARVEREAKEKAEQLAAEERTRLEAIATEARKQNNPALETAATEASKQVALPVLPRAAFAPTTAATGTGTRRSAEAVITDEDAFYKGLADGTVSRMAAPIDQAWLNRQAKDFPKEEFEKRYPGTEWRPTGGLTARGRR